MEGHCVGAGIPWKKPPLLQDLAAHRTAATATLLKDNPLIALGAVVHGLGLRIFYNGRSLPHGHPLPASEN